MGTILVLLAAAALATGLHARLMPKRRGPLFLAGLAALYAFVIVWILCAVNLLRGRGALLVFESFDAVKNFVVYGPLTVLLAAVLPLFARRGRRILGRLFRPRPTEEAVPAPERPAEEPEKKAASETFARRTEVSLAAQEEEMVAEHVKVVPRRRATGAPAPMLYNIGTRDVKAAKKTPRQRLVWALIYAFLAFLVFVIVYGVLSSPGGA